MNITKIKQASIRGFFIKNSKEMKEINLIKSRVCDRIYNILLNSLNDSERYLMNMGTTDYNKINSISIDRSGNYSELFGFDFPTSRIRPYYWENEDHHYDEVYGIFSIFDFGEGRQLPKVIENKYVMGWKQLSSLNPGEFDLIKSDLKKAIDLMNILYYKISELSNLLNSSEIGLADVKKYFPELYKVIKS